MSRHFLNENVVIDCPASYRRQPRDVEYKQNDAYVELGFRIRFVFCQIMCLF